MTDTTRSFGVLPAHGYKLIRIDENDSEPVETRLSEPELVLGFCVTQQGGYFGVSPVTPFGVHHDENRYALICPDGKFYLVAGFDNHVFDSIDLFKQHLRRQALAVYREMAADCREKGERKDAAMFSRVAKKLQEDVDENE